MSDKTTTEFCYEDVYLGRNGDGERVWIEAKYSDGRLSITGEAVPKHCRRETFSGSFGQIYDSLPSDVRSQKIRAIWQRWHLNDMQAGCEHQRALGWNSYDEHPSEACPVCGYKFGSAWLTEEIPADVLDELRALLAPESAEVSS